MTSQAHVMLSGHVFLYGATGELVSSINLTPRQVSTAVLAVDLPDVNGIMSTPVAVVKACGNHQYYVCCISEPNFSEVLKSLGVNFQIKIMDLPINQVTPKLERPAT